MNGESPAVGVISRGQVFRSANGRDKPLTAASGVAQFEVRLSSPAASLRQHSKTEL